MHGEKNDTTLRHGSSSCNAHPVLRSFIGVGAQPTLGGQDIFAGKKEEKINKMPEFYMIFVRKIIKIP